MKNILFLTFASFIISCSSKQNDETLISHKWEVILIETEDKGLAIDDVPYLLDKDQKEYYVNYNNITHTLNYYNLETRSFEKQIQFYKSGTNQLSGINEYCIYGDTIILYANLALRFFNQEGGLIKKLSLNDLCPELGDRYKLEKKGITIDNLMELFLNNKNRNLLLRTYKQDLMPYDDDFYKNPYFCLYDLNAGTGIAIPVIFPKELNGKYYYADLATPHIIDIDNLIIYNFHFKSSVYIYNKKNRKTEEIQIKANHIPHKTAGIKRASAEDKLHIISSIFFEPKYHNLKYDPWRDLYYLLYSDKMDIKNIKYKGNVKYLIVLNSKFEKLGEINIDPFLSSKFVVSKDGLLFRNTKEDSYNELKLHSLSVDTVNTIN